MIVEPHGDMTEEQEQRRVEEIVGRGPSGALALAGSAVLVVLALWVAFYLVVFLPRA